MPRCFLIAPVVCLFAACGGSPNQPSESKAASSVLLGQTVSAIDGSAASGASVQVNTLGPVTADGQGNFTVEVGSTGPHRLSLRAGSFIERETTAAASSDRLRLSLIPDAFDLTAFDEMFRTTNGRLQRWISAPSLVVLGSVMTYRAGGGDDYEATAEQLSDDEVSQMVANLTEGLALLTGETYTSFTSVSVERPAAGARVAVNRGGRIVVGRYKGVSSTVNTIGYGQWSELPDGAVVGGSIFLDRDFDRDDARRRRLRIHELGHALGYMHVKARTSIMNTNIGPEPTDFDRAAAKIAFQRAPGNRAPDIDPTSSLRTSSVTGASGGRWMPPVICQ